MSFLSKKEKITLGILLLLALFCFSFGIRGCIIEEKQKTACIDLNGVYINGQCFKAEIIKPL